MIKSIVFPVNNKGGVGKTSLLVDLASSIAQRNAVGLIDTDHQASLAGTFLGHRDLTCKPLEEYLSVEPSEVTLSQGTSIGFSNPLSTMQLDIQATKAKLAVFPAGMLYEYPGRISNLEKILKGPLEDCEILMVDLPPIPHPAMVLDHTISPIVNILGMANLFPLIVSTPEHNSIEIGLRQYSEVEKYLLSRGIPKDKIFPISVLNKLPFEIDERGRPKANIDTEVIRKLKELGILYTSPESEHYAQLNHLYDFFRFNGRKIRSVSFPFVEEIKDGRFSLLWGEEPEIHHYPHLVDLVRDKNFSVPADMNPTQRVYMYGLRELTNFITDHSGFKPRRNYVKREHKFDRNKLSSAVVEELRTFLTGYYHNGAEDYSEHVLEEKYGCSSKEIWINIPKSFKPEKLARALAEVQTEIHPGARVNAEKIREALTQKPEDPDGRDHEPFYIRSSEGHEIFSIDYLTYDPNVIRFGFLRESELGNTFYGDLDAKRYLGLTEVLLNGLERAVS